MNTKTYSYTLEELEKLKSQIDSTQSELDTTKALTIANMWENDLMSI